MRRRPLKGWFKKLAHALALILGWLLFFWFWWHVLATQEIYGPELALLLLGSAAVFPALTLYWVLHNRRIYRAKGPRRQPRIVDEHYPQDWEGRRVVADWPSLVSARSITIQVEPETKVYQ